MNKFIESRPQRLCLMCGRCCRVVTTPIPYDKIILFANEGDEESRDFLNIFESYPSIDAARKVHPEVVDNILAVLEKSGKSTEEVTFYKCKYLLDNNSCEKYENRPELCKRFPSSPWAVVPPGCGYEGWMFKYKEELKQKIRKQKESLIELEALLKTTETPQDIEKIQNATAKINKTVELFAKYGSRDW